MGAGGVAPEPTPGSAEAATPGGGVVAATALDEGATTGDAPGAHEPSASTANTITTTRTGTGTSKTRRSPKMGIDPIRPPTKSTQSHRSA